MMKLKISVLLGLLLLITTGVFATTRIHQIIGPIVSDEGNVTLFEDTTGRLAECGKKPFSYIQRLWNPQLFWGFGPGNGTAGLLHLQLGSDTFPLEDLDFPVTVEHVYDTVASLSYGIYIKTKSLKSGDYGSGFLVENFGGSDGASFAINTDNNMSNACAIALFNNNSEDLHDQYLITAAQRHGRGIVIQSMGTGESLEIRRTDNSTGTTKSGSHIFINEAAGGTDLGHLMAIRVDGYGTSDLANTIMQVNYGPGTPVFELNQGGMASFSKSTPRAQVDARAYDRWYSGIFNALSDDSVVLGSINTFAAIQGANAGLTLTSHLTINPVGGNLGIGPFVTAPATTLHVNGATTLGGAVFSPVTNVTAATYTVLSTDSVVVFNRATHIATTLIAATGSGRHLWLHNKGDGNVTFDGYSTDTINGDNNQTILKYEGLHIIDIASGQWGVF